MIDLPPPIPNQAIVITIEETLPSNTQPTKDTGTSTKEHRVVVGETLTSISELHTVPLERLWAANPQLSNPDLLNVNEQLKIPSNEEVLPERPFPAMISGDTQLASDPPSGGFSGLIGSIGYAKPYGNCVDEPGVNSPRNGTNPINWPILTRTPTIGATALFNFNHTGVVVGIWSNGDLEIRHQNYSYNRHRFPISDFRGFR